MKSILKNVIVTTMLPFWFACNRPPDISGISPNPARPGETITITGHFPNDNVKVQFPGETGDKLAGKVEMASSSEIRVVVPAWPSAALSGDVEVRTNEGSDVVGLRVTVSEELPLSMKSIVIVSLNDFDEYVCGLDLRGLLSCFSGSSSYPYGLDEEGTSRLVPIGNGEYWKSLSPKDPCGTLADGVVACWDPVTRLVSRPLTPLRSWRFVERFDLSKTVEKYCAVAADNQDVVCWDTEHAGSKTYGTSNGRFDFWYDGEPCFLDPSGNFSCFGGNVDHKHAAFFEKWKLMSGEGIFAYLVSQFNRVFIVNLVFPEKWASRELSLENRGVIVDMSTFRNNVTCLTLADKSLWCSQLSGSPLTIGLDRTTNIDVFYHVPGGDNVSAFAIGRNVGCAAREGGTMVCFGGEFATGAERWRQIKNDNVSR